jgi:hypothetical protein
MRAATQLRQSCKKAQSTESGTEGAHPVTQFSLRFKARLGAMTSSPSASRPLLVIIANCIMPD